MLSYFKESPFDKFNSYCEKLKEVAWIFQQAIECYVTDDCNNFKEISNKINVLQKELNSLKFNIINQKSKYFKNISKYSFVSFIQTHICINYAMKDALDWALLKSKPSLLPSEIQKGFFLFTNAVVDSVEATNKLVCEFIAQHKKLSKKKAKKLIESINLTINQFDESKALENSLKKDLLNFYEKDSLMVFHLIKLVEYIAKVGLKTQKASNSLLSLVIKVSG